MGPLYRQSQPTMSRRIFKSFVTISTLGQAHVENNGPPPRNDSESTLGRGILVNPALLSSTDISSCDGATASDTPTSAGACARPYATFAGLGGSNFNSICNYNSLHIQLPELPS